MQKRQWHLSRTFLFKFLAVVRPLYTECFNHKTSRAFGMECITFRNLSVVFYKMLFSLYFWSWSMHNAHPTDKILCRKSVETSNEKILRSQAMFEWYLRCIRKEKWFLSSDISASSWMFDRVLPSILLHFFLLLDGKRELI